jgi:hypothetical protein
VKVDVTAVHYPYFYLFISDYQYLTRLSISVYLNFSIHLYLLTYIRLWADTSRYVSQSLTNTVHTNTIYQLYTFVVYFPLHVSAVHIVHHQVETYRFRKKGATEEAMSKFVCLLTFWHRSFTFKF